MRALCISALAVATFASALASPTFAVTASKKKSYSEAATTAAEKIHPGVVVSGDKKSLTISSSSRLVLRTGPENDMMSFRALGLRNPTLNVGAGTKFTVLFINTDGDMLHSFRLTAKPPPFDAKMGKADTAGSADMPHESGNVYMGQELIITAPKQKGTYSYVCTIPGHASAGMYGVIIVR